MIDPKWLSLARGETGVREGAGGADNPRVVAYFRDAGFPQVTHDATAWCAAFVGAMLKRADVKPLGSLWALDAAKWGVGLAQPQYGCIGVKRRDGGGHVGFVVGANAKEIFMLGGNQGDAVGIASFPRAQFVAFRWPANIALINQGRPMPANLIAARGVRES